MIQISNSTTDKATVTPLSTLKMWHEITVFITDSSGRAVESVSSGVARAHVVIDGERVNFHEPLALTYGDRLWAAFVAPLESVTVEFVGLPNGISGHFQLQSWSAVQ
ncbi:MAG: hypothetical protein ACRC4K_14585 [Plesiomonas shigelloides]